MEIAIPSLANSQVVPEEESELATASAVKNREVTAGKNHNQPEATVFAVKNLEVTAGKYHNQLEATAFAVKNLSREFGGEKRCSKCNHNTKNCRAHLTESETSEGNHATSHVEERKETNFPFTAEEC
uniref:Uncharacterized protein n=1 Tax=Populus alba TaxID=43335 RepID=A0A4U5PYV1_POPAL|nr:hypothetical protein D5086_0000161630 [Populus alba]